MLHNAIAQFQSKKPKLSVQGTGRKMWQFTAGILLFHDGDEADLAEFRSKLVTMAPGGRSMITEISFDKARAVAAAHKAGQPAIAGQGAGTSHQASTMHNAAQAQLLAATGPDGRALDEGDQAPAGATPFVQAEDVAASEDGPAATGGAPGGAPAPAAPAEPFDFNAG